MDIGKLSQQSFIPKQPTGQVFTPSGYNHVSPFTIVSVIIFIVSLGVAGGIFLFTTITQNRITTLETQIQQTSESFDQPTIELLSTVGEKIELVKGMLRKHNAPTLLFNFLEQVTLPTVSYNDMTYVYDGATNPHVTLQGVAESFSSLAAQSDVITAQPNIQYVQFSDFSLDQFGNVTFSLSFYLKPALSLYAATVQTTAEVVPSVTEINLPSQQ